MANKTVNLVLQNASGASEGVPAAHEFTVLDEPVLLSVVPAFGPELVATAVTVTGTNLQSAGVDGVEFGGSPATSVLVVNETTLTCNVPALPTGFVNVQLTKAGLDIGNLLVNGYEYQMGEA